MTHRPFLPCCCLLLAGALLGCGSEASEETAIDVELVPDINLNSANQIVTSIDTLRLIIDSPEGLYPPGSESIRGNVEVRDADDDPSDLELIATVKLPSGKLPTVRLEQGGLPDVSLDIRVIGSQSDRPDVRLAEGRVRGIRFARDQVKPLSVAFNLRPEVLPPRVTEVQPADDTFLQPCRVDTIVVVFSKPIEHTSLIEPGHFEVDRDPAPASIVVDPSGFIATYTTGDLKLEEGNLSYRVTIRSEVKSRDGVALDQVGAEPGAQPYSGLFTMRCDFMEPALVPVLCSPEEPDGSCPGDGRFRCDAGACVPAGCKQSLCGPGFVCDPATLLCEVDCRAYGDVEVCPETRPVCDPGSGACVP